MFAVIGMSPRRSIRSGARVLDVGLNEKKMIKVGTSGFSFPDWKGTIYPAGLGDREMLPFYEKNLGFNVLEVNFTYYSLPSPKSFAAMSQKTSKEFEFVVKAFKGMPRPCDRWLHRFALNR